MNGMMSRHIEFERVKVRSSKKGLCSVCGKPCQRSKIFEATVNPFNKNPDGTVKTWQQVHSGLVIKAKAWQKEPVIHEKCE